jgi:hypothetical protein
MTSDLSTMHSFEGPTKVTQAIASQIADYSKHSIEQSTKAKWKNCSLPSPRTKRSRCRRNMPEPLTKIM